ncbi:MAG: hypothetical protein WC150_09840 [Bacteroidia bacterium]
MIKLPIVLSLFFCCLTSFVYSQKKSDFKSISCEIYEIHDDTVNMKRISGSVSFKIRTAKHKAKIKVKNDSLNIPIVLLKDSGSIEIKIFFKKNSFLITALKAEEINRAEDISIIFFKPPFQQFYDNYCKWDKDKYEVTSGCYFIFDSWAVCAANYKPRR